MKTIYQVYCFDCKSCYEQTRDPKPECCGACGSNRVGVLAEEEN